MVNSLGQPYNRERWGSSVRPVASPTSTETLMTYMAFLLCLLLACPLSLVRGPLPGKKPIPGNEQRTTDHGPSRFFKITVVDADTARGVPLVELRTVHGLRFYTDSNGVVAFREPGLMGQRVFFHVKSHGYEFAKDGFGFRGKALAVKEGGSAVLKIHRLNIAERLYRVTGGGIYAESVLVGEKVPLRRPVLNGLVLGSDSVVSAVYRGKISWFWGDTNRPGYPLGNFQVPGATSELPDRGGLDPDKGVDLSYFLDDKGFAKQTAPMPGPGPTWINGLVVLRDEKKSERLFAAYVKVKPPLTVYERGLAEWDDEKKEFKKITAFPPDAPAYPRGHPFLHVEKGVQYVYFADPYPLTRVKADPESLARLDRYETYSPLKTGSRLDRPQIDRQGDKVRYGWKRNTPAVGPAEQARLIRGGHLKPREALLHLQDVDTGKAVLAHGGSVCWNAWRKRWVMIAVQSSGTSFLGEVWYAEGDTPLGPWVYARKVVTHDRYSFYNPKQHPYFDQKGGRRIYFEGTYTHTFSGNPDQTPRYDYNQMMYRLDLSDSRLALPVPVYVPEKGAQRFRTRDGLKEGAEGQRLAFLALDRPVQGTIPLSETAEGWLQTAGLKGARPLFHALSTDSKEAPKTTVPLYEFVSVDGKQRVYSTAKEGPGSEYRRSARPVCLVYGIDNAGK
jgi:hypothetical protein